MNYYSSNFIIPVRNISIFNIFFHIFLFIYKSHLKKQSIFRPWDRLDPQSRQASWLGKLDFCGGRWIVLRFGSAFVSKPQSQQIHWPLLFFSFFSFLSKRDHDSFEDLKSIFPPYPSTLYIYHRYKILLSENNFLRQFS